MTWHLIDTDDTLPVRLTTWRCGSCRRLSTVAHSRYASFDVVSGKVTTVVGEGRPRPCDCGAPDRDDDDDEITEPNARRHP